MVNGFLIFETLICVAIFSIISTITISISTYNNFFIFNRSSIILLNEIRASQYQARSLDQHVSLIVSNNILTLCIKNDCDTKQLPLSATISINRFNGLALSPHFTTAKAGTLSLQYKQSKHTLSFPVGLSLLQFK